MAIILDCNPDFIGFHVRKHDLVTLIRKLVYPRYLRYKTNSVYHTTNSQ